jgi:transcriptional regulator with XRE-family HTH domain
MDAMDLLIKNLSRLIEKTGISGNEICRRAFVNKNTVTAIMTKKSNPTIRVLMKIAKVLEVDFVDLFEQ